VIACCRKKLESNSTERVKHLAERSIIYFIQVKRKRWWQQMRNDCWYGEMRLWIYVVRCSKNSVGERKNQRYFIVDALFAFKPMQIFKRKSGVGGFTASVSAYLHQLYQYLHQFLALVIFSRTRPWLSFVVFLPLALALNALVIAKITLKWTEYLAWEITA